MIRLTQHNLIESLVRAGLYAALMFGALIYNGYGSPEYWFSDELLWVVEAMLTTHQLDPNFFAYPAGLQIYLTCIGYKILTAFSANHEIDRDLLIHIGRSISAVFFVSAVFLAEKTVSLINGRRSDIKTIILIGTSCALIHHAHIATAQASLIFGITLSYFAFANVITNKTRRSYYLAAFACGIAVGAKYPGIYLGTALPALYLLAFRPTIVDFLGAMIATAVVSGAAVVLTNPFIVLSFPKFKTDVLDTAFTEAPPFQSAESGIAVVLHYTWCYLQAFFTEYAVIPLLAIIATAVIAWVLCLKARFRNSDDDRALPRLAEMTLIVSITAAAYLILQIKININQSRYYIPIGIATVLIFSMSVDVLLIALRRGKESWLYEFHRKAGRGLVWIAVACVLGLLVLNGIVHVAVFPLSAKLEAARYAESKLHVNPETKLLRLASGARSPFLVDNTLCSNRCYLITLEDLPQRKPLENWDNFLTAVFETIEKINPDIIAAEIIIFHWNFFVPTGHQFSERLKHQNPGPEAWQRHFTKLGYGKPLLFPRIASLDPIQRLIGPKYQTTTEGIGGDVVLFERVQQ